jgi:DNA-binding CsgD family transcriptional regulator
LHKKRPLHRRGSWGLSGRQRQIVQLVSQGLKNTEIASELGLSLNVVRNELNIIYDKLGVSSRVELVLWYTAGTQKEAI